MMINAIVSATIALAAISGIIGAVARWRAAAMMQRQDA